MRCRFSIWLVLFWLAGCALPRPVPLPTAAELANLPPLQGVLPGETVLSGRVYLADDVLIPADARLVIRAGTTVFVRVAESTKIDPEYLSSATELLVRGTLRIEGSAAQPVRFVPVSDQAEGVLWSGITLDGARDSHIAHLDLSQAEAGVQCIGSSPVIESSRFVGCRYGLIVQQGSSPQLRQNQILQGEGGIFCWRESHPLIENNLIRDNDEEGIFVDASSRPQLTGNRIVGNDVGLALYPRELAAAADQARGNRQDLLWLGQEGGR